MYSLIRQLRFLITYMWCCWHDRHGKGMQYRWTLIKWASWAVKVADLSKAQHKHYHWRKLPQVRFLSQKKNLSRQKHMLVVIKHVFCHDKSMLVATKVFVATKLCLLFLSWQNFCCDRHVFVMTKVLLQHVCHDKHNFVATTSCLFKASFCCHKRHVL